MSATDVVVTVVSAVGVVAVLLLVALVTANARLRSALARHTAASRAYEGEPAGQPRAAVVVNPTKFASVVPLRAELEQVCTDLGWAPPLWLETTPDDPGAGQAREALAERASVVVAIGGDGTVRSVAEVLAGTTTPMGLVPAGTGNLLARNLDVLIRPSREISASDAGAAMRVALTGEDRPIDIGWSSIERPDGRVEPERAFLVMAGMGFDAAIMAEVPEALKAKVGVVAYFVSGLKQFQGDRVKVTVTVDGTTHHRRVRTVVVGNVGRVQGGLALMPDALVDDGYLDVLSVGPRTVIGWLDVARRIITRHRQVDNRLSHWRGRTIEIVADSPQQAQMDGDTVGEARVLRMRVDEGALRVRVASGASRAELREFAGTRVQERVEAAATRLTRGRLEAHC